ncbi:unnamed protein product [Prunus brigantina]
MSVMSSVTPSVVQHVAGQRSQERERFEPYGESSSLGASGRTQASGYGQHSQPPTNSWGQSQPTWVNQGSTRPAKTTYGPLHALAVSLGQSSPTHSTIQQLGPGPTMAVQPHAFRAASSQQYGQSNSTVSPLQASLFPSGSHLQYGSAMPMATHTHPGQTYDAYLMPPGSVATAAPLVQIKPQNDAQQVQRPLPTQLELPPQDPRTEDVRRTTKDGLAQRRPGAPGYTEPYPPGKPRTWHDLLIKAFWAYHISKHSATGIAPYTLTYGQDTDELGNLEQSRLDAYNSMQAQEQMAPRAYNKKVKQKTFAEGDLVKQKTFPIGTKNPRIGAFSPNGKGRS